MNDSLRRLRFLLALCGVLSLWPAAWTVAQPFGGPANPETMKARLAAETDALIQQLELTDAQEARVRPILEAHNEQRVTRFAKARENPTREAMQAMRKDAETLRAETEKKLAAVLTEAQMTTYKKIQEDRAAQRRGRRGM